MTGALSILKGLPEGGKVPVWRRAVCAPSARGAVIAGGMSRSAIWVGLSDDKNIRLLIIAGVAFQRLVSVLYINT